MSRQTTTAAICVLVSAFLSTSVALAADWPAYRADARRSGYTSEAIESRLRPTWSYKAPHAPTPAWARNGRVCYDNVFQPVVAGDTVYFGDHVEGKLRALDLATGRVKWQFQTNGPIRLAPAVWKDIVLVASDDGHLYALSCDDGSLRWSCRPGPSDELVLGNGYMISKWPVRGSPTVEGDTVYVGAGIWPTDGFYLVALDAATGKVKWRNADSGRLGLKQGHGAYSKSGPAAQGYLSLTDTDILVPPGRNLPAFFDKQTGKFKYVDFNKKTGASVFGVHKDVFLAAGSIWLTKNCQSIEKYIGMSQQRNWPLIEILPKSVMTPTGVVAALGKQVHGYTWASKHKVWKRNDVITRTLDYTGLDKKWSMEAPAAVGELLVAGDRIILGLDGAIEMVDQKSQDRKAIASKLDGTVGGLAYANGHLIASTDTGHIYCFATDGQAKADRTSRTGPPQARETAVDPKAVIAAKTIIAECATTKGYALDLSCGEGDLSLAMAQASDMYVIAVENDAILFNKARERFQKAGLYGKRMMIFKRDPAETGLPNMFANVIVSGQSVLDGAAPAGIMAEARRLRRPYGGTICTVADGKVVTDRSGPVAGGGQWTHQYADPANTLCSADSAISGELTMLWYRDYSMPSSDRHARGPAPLAENGILYQACPIGIIAVDAFNGHEIWQYKLDHLLTSKAGYWPIHTGGLYCLGDGTLFVRTGDKCLCLDARTGKLRRTIALPKTKGGDFWGYLAYSDGVLYGSAGNTAHYTFIRHPASPQVVEAKAVFALDPKTGRTLWQYESKGCVRNTAIAIDSRSLYLIDRPGHDPVSERLKRRSDQWEPKARPGGVLTALDKKTGEVKWTNDTNIDGIATLACDAARRVCIWRGSKLTGFDSDSGKSLYTAEISNSTKWAVRSPLIVNTTIHWEADSFNVETGKKLPCRFRRAYGCGSISASDHMLFFRSGTMGYVDLDAPRGPRGDITTKEIHNFGGIRPGCYINIVPVGGIALMPDSSASCVCSYLNQCWIALQPVRKK